MARHEVIMYSCDKCGHEDLDPAKFRHVTIEEVVPQGKKRPKPISERDLCVESCLGAPAVNRDKV